MIRNTKHIKVNEAAAEKAKSILLSEAFVPSYGKTLGVKEYLDNNFTKVVLDDIDENGYPKKIPAVQMMSGGQPLKTMMMSELLLHLEDKFQNMIKNTSDLRAFLQQVIRDWFMKRIDKNGILSVNHT